jgi:methylmalonyl-CoA mutase C-terminal domain/subunit
MKLVAAEGASHILVTGGGIIPDQDLQKLSEMGVGRLFRPGTKSDEYIAYLEDEIGRRRAVREAQEV